MRATRRFLSAGDDVRLRLADSGRRTALREPRGCPSPDADSLRRARQRDVHRDVGSRGGPHAGARRESGGVRRSGRLCQTRRARVAPALVRRRAGQRADVRMAAVPVASRRTPRCHAPRSGALGRFGDAPPRPAVLLDSAARRRAPRRGAVARAVSRVARRRFRRAVRLRRAMGGAASSRAVAIRSARARTRDSTRSSGSRSSTTATSAARRAAPRSGIRFSICGCSASCWRCPRCRGAATS